MKVEGGLNAAGHYGRLAQVFPMMPFPLALLFVQQEYGGRWSLASVCALYCRPVDTGITSIKQQEQGKQTRAAPGTATSHLSAHPNRHNRHVTVFPS